MTLVVTRENGQLELHEIDLEQAWFWTPEWTGHLDARLCLKRVEGHEGIWEVTWAADDRERMSEGESLPRE